MTALISVHCSFNTNTFIVLFFLLITTIKEYASENGCFVRRKCQVTNSNLLFLFYFIQLSVHHSCVHFSHQLISDACFGWISYDKPLYSACTIYQTGKVRNNNTEEHLAAKDPDISSRSCCWLKQLFTCAGCRNRQLFAHTNTISRFWGFNVWMFVYSLIPCRWLKKSINTV